MKKLFILMALLLPSSALAQVSAVNGYCTLGASQAVLSGLQSTNYTQGIIPTCTVTVYLTGTTNLASIYSNSSSTPLTNPFTASFNGQWLFYASPSNGVDVVLSGGRNPNFYPSPVTLTDIIPGGGGGAITPGVAPQATYYNTATTIAPATGSIVLPSTSTTVTNQYLNSAALIQGTCEYNVSAGGTITWLNPDVYGYGYLTPPSVTFTGGGGTGLAATAVLGGLNGQQVVGYNITNPGSGYTGCPSSTVGIPPANTAAVSVVDYRFGPNATQAVNSVASFGAKCDGATDDTLAFKGAIHFSHSVFGNGTISIPPGRVCVVGSSSSGTAIFAGTQWAAGDDGTAPTTGTCANRNQANGISGSVCSIIPPEAHGYIPYALDPESGSGNPLTILGNGSVIKGPFNPLAASGTNLGLLDLPTSLQTMPYPYFALFGGNNMGGLVLRDLTIENYFIGEVSGEASDQSFDNVTFVNMGVQAILSNSQASTWTNITSSQTAAGFVLGGWWECGNVTQGCLNNFNIFDASSMSNVNFNGLTFGTLANYITAQTNLNTWFNNFFYQSQNNYNRWSDQNSATLTPGGCNISQCVSDFQGIVGTAFSLYSRNGRSQAQPVVTNLNSRSASNYEVVMTFPSSPTVNVGSGEGIGCNNGQAVYGSATCPNPYNFNWNRLLSPVFMWRPTGSIKVSVTQGTQWTTTVAGPSILGDSVNSAQQTTVGFNTSSGASTGEDDASYYKSRNASATSNNAYYGPQYSSLTGGGKGMYAQFNGYSYLTNLSPDKNLYFYEIGTTFATGQNSTVSSAQVALAAPGLRIRSQEAQGLQGGNLTSLTIANPGSGYAVYTTGNVTITGCQTVPTAMWYADGTGTIVTIKVTFGGYGCTAANPPVATMPASSGVTATLTPVYSAWDQSGIITDFASKRFNLLTTPLAIPAGNSVQITGVTIPGLNNGSGATPPFAISVPFMVYEPGSSFTGLTYRAVTTNTNTATVTIENNTTGSLTAPTGTYEALWIAGEQLSLGTLAAASGTVGTVAPRYINATNSTGAGTMTGSATTATHTFATTFGGTPNCQVTPTSNSGGYWISTQNTTTLTVTYITSGAQTFNALCLGSGGAW